MGTNTGSIEARVTVAAARAAALAAEREDELILRDRAILEAVDAGWSLAEVARWARLTAPRIGQIVAVQAAQ